MNMAEVRKRLASSKRSLVRKSTVSKKTSLLSKHILIKEIKKPLQDVKQNNITEPMSAVRVNSPQNGRVSSTMFAPSPFNRDMDNVIIIPRQIESSPGANKSLRSSLIPK